MKKTRSINKANKRLTDFLKKAKAGKYAIIERSSLKYSRISEDIIAPLYYEDHYFSLG